MALLEEQKPAEIRTAPSRLRAAIRVGGWTLRAASRTRFFWIWSSIVFFIILSLNHITFFDLQGGGILISEYFLAAVVLSAAVTSIAFQLQITLKQKKQGAWSLLLAGPASPVSVAAGLGAAIIILQLAVALLFALEHRVVMAALGRPMPNSIWSVFSILCLQIVCLSVFHLLVSVIFRETWALLLMVGGYLLGQVSEPLYRSVSGPGTSLLDLVYSLVPDLQPLGYLGGLGANIPGKFIINAGLNCLLYVSFALLAAALLLPRAAASRRGS